MHRPVATATARSQHDLFALMKQLHSHYERMAASMLEPLQLTTTEYFAIAHLRRVGAARAAEMARTARQSRQSMHATLRGLTQAGLVECWKGDRPGRDVKVGLTRQGDSVAADAESAIAHLHGVIEDQLGARERVLLQSLLESTLATLKLIDRHPVVFDD